MLSVTGRRVRAAVTVIVALLTLAGTFVGQDDDFPFGPFRMYSTRAAPDQPVVSTRVVAVTAAGAEIRLSGGAVGLRRAEFEGQLDRLVADPALLGLLADSYLSRHPDAPDLVPVSDPALRNVRKIDKQYVGAAPGLDDGADSSVKVQLPILGDAR